MQIAPLMWQTKRSMSSQKHEFYRASHTEHFSHTLPAPNLDLGPCWQLLAELGHQERRGAVLVVEDVGPSCRSAQSLHGSVLGLQEWLWSPANHPGF